MIDETGDFMRTLTTNQHGDIFIAVYEINSRHEADCFYSWDSETGPYIFYCGPHPDNYEPENPTIFSLCLASDPGDVILRFDDPNGEWLLALAARLSEHLAKLETCWQPIQIHYNVDEADGPRTLSDCQLSRAFCTVRNWLNNGNTQS